MLNLRQINIIVRVARIIINNHSAFRELLYNLSLYNKRRLKDN
jgi:hypothetical protein